MGGVNSDLPKMANSPRHKIWSKKNLAHPKSLHNVMGSGTLPTNP
jgi:hypothetical protein